MTNVQDGYTTTYNHVNSKIVETTGGFNTKYYNGFAVETSFWDNGRKIKVEEYYDNNGLVCMSDWYTDGEYQKTRFYVYDFGMGTMFTYDTEGFFLIENIYVYTSGIFESEMYERFNFKLNYDDFKPKTWYSLYAVYGA